MVNEDAMVGLTPRQRRREKRYQEILDAALELVRQEGLEGLTVGRLARRLDYTAGALYRYFPSKDALLARLQRSVLEEVGRRLAASLAAFNLEVEALDLPRAVRALAALIFAAEQQRLLASEAPAHHHLVSLMLGDPRQLLDDKLAGANVEVVLGLMAQLARLFEAAVQAGALTPDPAPERAVLLLSAVQGTLQMDKLSRFSPALASERLVGVLVRTLLGGWGAEAGQITRAAQVVVAHLADEEPTR